MNGRFPCVTLYPFQILAIGMGSSDVPHDWPNKKLGDLFEAKEWQKVQLQTTNSVNLFIFIQVFLEKKKN